MLTATRPLPQPQYLWFFILSFSMVISISNWYDARLVSLFGLVVSPGALSYPLSFILSDTITEVYGYKNARLAMWAALFFNLLFILFGQIVIHLPSPAFATDNEAFDKILNLNIWVFIASFISYIIAEPLNAYLIAKLKIVFQGKYIGIRFLTSTIIAEFIDSILFVSIAFHTMVSTPHLLTMIINIWIIKCLIELICLPFSIRLTRQLKSKEQLDIYDHQTNFNIFSLDANYDPRHNQYAN